MKKKLNKNKKTAKSGNRRSSKKPLGKAKKKVVLGQRGRLYLFCAYANGNTREIEQWASEETKHVFRSPPLAFPPHSGVVMV